MPAHVAGRVDRINALEGQALAARESPEGIGLEGQHGKSESGLCEHVAGITASTGGIEGCSGRAGGGIGEDGEDGGDGGVWVVLASKRRRVATVGEWGSKRTNERRGMKERTGKQRSPRRERAVKSRAARSSGHRVERGFG